MRVAAIQMKAVLGAVEKNCASAEQLILNAVDQGAELIVLPEFFTSGVAFHPSLLDAVRPLDGAPFQLLCRLAKENNVVIGGSYIASRAEGVFNTFALVFPDGNTFYHDKDIPSMWENCYYQGGDDDGIASTAVGSIGIAVCWELIRTQTIKRLRGNIDFAIGGSCWWDAPYGAETQSRSGNRNMNVELYEKTPPTFARLLGVPFVHAAHVGEFEGLSPGAEHRPYKSRFLGRAQIIDGHGKLLAVSQSDGDDVVIAEINPGRIENAQQHIPESFWLHEMSESALKAWDKQNAFGQEYYQQVTLPYRSAQKTRANK